MREELPAARLVVKLVSQDADDPYLAEMRALAGQLALGDAIVYVPQVSYAEIPDLYRAADVVISTPSSDGLPVSVLEAMACGTPVIASDLPALRELTDDGADLSLVPARDVEALSPRHPGPAGRSRATGRRSPPRTWQPSAAPPTFGVEMTRMEDLYRSLNSKTGCQDA